MINFKIFSKLLIASTIVFFSANSHALLLSPATVGVQTGDEPNANQEESYIQSAFGLGGTNLTLLYKADASDDGSVAEEDGGYATSYSTMFDFVLDEGEADITGAVISWLNGEASINCPSCYVAVKDGRNQPAYYFFDISEWNGTDALTFENFWENTQGSISHIAIWGYEYIPVPQPGTFGLLGLGLLGLVLGRRKLART
jgi:hypothetical protein